jgi:hypothetical protein
METETSALFAGTGSSVKVKVKKEEASKNRFDLMKENEEKRGDESGEDEDEKMTWMREMAKRLSQQMTKEAEKRKTGEKVPDRKAEKHRKKKKHRKDASE